MKSVSKRGRSVALPVVAVAAVAVVLLIATPFRFDLPNPFGSEEVDRSPDVVLLSIKDLSRYEAAYASFQVIVDLEHDVKYVPSAIAGERSLFLAQGSVEGYVEFSGLSTGAIEASADRRSVTVTLPPAMLSKPRLDTKESRLLSRNRGVLDRVGGVFSDNPTSERELYIKAEERIASAAAQSELRKRTEENTRSMLTGMLRAFGYRDITVQFEQDPRQ